MRLRLDVGYDGTDFHGWAAQAGLRTVQGVLEHWVPLVLRLNEPVRLVCAGRTDAGVHALGQVAHLDLPDALGDPEEVVALLQRRLGRVLPEDVVVNRTTIAPSGFDARFSAIWRRYRFRLTDGVPDPLRRRFVVASRHPLDADAMATAAAPLLGLHDFGGFCRAREGATTIRSLEEAVVTRHESGVDVVVRADAFCHSMVRSVVGALVMVGDGRRPSDWPATLLDRSDRAGEITVLPPHGLVLEAVGYPADELLGARASEARAVRTLPEGDV